MAKPLVRIATLDRTVHKLVRAESVAGVKAAAITKLGLDAGVNYKLVVDNGGDEGIEIEDDDILEDLASSYPAADRFALCVMPQNEVWTKTPRNAPNVPEVNRANVVATFDAVQEGIQQVVRSADGNMIVMDFLSDTGDACVTVTHTSGDKHILPMGEIVGILEEALTEVEKVPQPQDIIHIKSNSALKASQVIVRHLVSLQDFSLPSATRYAKAVMQYREGRYKKVFERSCAGVVVSDGGAWFSSKIYNGLNYSKGKKGKKNTRKATDRVHDDQDDVEAPKKKVRRRRVRGEHCCPNYLPLLPTNETPVTQETKRLQLLNKTNERCFDQETQRLFTETYPAQRNDILTTNPMSMIAITFVSRWPCFLEGRCLMWHASILCKPKDFIGDWDCEAVFERNFAARTPDILNCMKTIWAKELRQTRPSKRRSHAQAMVDLIQHAENQGVAQRTSMAKSIAVLPNVCAYMRENFQFCLVVVEPDADEDTILAAIEAANENPIIVVKGEGLLDEGAQCEVRVLDTISIKVADIVQGYLIWFMSFFIFDYCYTKEVQSTLEFIQGFFLGMTGEGDRRENAKRNVDVVDSMVMELAETLKNFNSQWNL